MATEDRKIRQDVPLSKLEMFGVKILNIFMERDASTPRFWIVTTVAMLLVTAGPMVLIFLFFLARDHGLVN